METVLVQLNNDKALKLLQELEDLKIIKLLDQKKQESISLSNKYAGKLSGETVEKLQRHITQSRESWK